ncbi:MAG: hypothetical protein L6W00_17030 [Lentisphaeria bacterium]|nr:MAG: hypothetical protein L6W00_17030 [Lentisphaeria bacterium]
MVRRRQAGLNALQIWNEPDLKRLPADQYLSLQAVASYILRAGGIDLPLVGAGFSSWQTGERLCSSISTARCPHSSMFSRFTPTINRRRCFA